MNMKLDPDFWAPGTLSIRVETSDKNTSPEALRKLAAASQRRYPSQGSVDNLVEALRAAADSLEEESSQWRDIGRAVAAEKRVKELEDELGECNKLIEQLRIDVQDAQSDASLEYVRAQNMQYDYLQLRRRIEEFEDEKAQTHIPQSWPTWEMICAACPPGEVVDHASMGTALRAAFAAAPGQKRSKN